MCALRRPFPTLLLTALLGACTVGPDFVPPRIDAPPAWNDPARAAPGAVTMQSEPDPRWWDGFRDPVLTSLIERAAAGNLDVQQAVLRIAQARQNEAVARAAGLPMLNATTSYTRQQLGLRRSLGQVGDLGGSGGGSGNGQASGLVERLSNPFDLFQATFDASWELDLFGRVRRRTEQAGAQTRSRVEDARDGLVTLEAEVAQAYAQLRGAQALDQVQRENVASARGVLDLTQRLQRNGLATELDVANQRAQLTNFEAQLPQYERQAQQAMNRLSVLLGQPPGALDAELATAAPIPPVPPAVPVGLPATLARRRPDIRRAEANLHAATAGIGAAVADFYPDVSLTGSLGTRGITASSITNWGNHFYSLGPSVSLPIFQGGRLTANLRLARAQEAEAALAYRATVLNALREVEDNLTALRTDARARDSLAQTVTAGELALYLSRNRFENRLSSFIDVLIAQTTLVNARQQLVQATMTFTTDAVALYKALGGGWQDTAPSPLAGIPPPGGGTPIEVLSLDSLAGVDRPGRKVPTDVEAIAVPR